jgi:hypothetical protein
MRIPVARDKAAIPGGISRLRAESQTLRQDREQLAAEELKHSPTPVDYSAIRDHILASLKLGKQAPQYKAAAKAFDEFIKEISGRHP